MTRGIVRFDPPDTAPTVDRPRPDRLLQGNPRRDTWTLYESASKDLSCGIWHCEVGAWRIVFPAGKEEYFFVLEGVVRLHDVHGSVTEVRAGQGAVIPAGFEGVFEVVEPVRKHFVVVERAVTAQS
jgi:hypothetical protein|nr:cupin domain-containing protein [uncultured Caldimonas sp.]